MCVRHVSDTETEGEWGKEMQLNKNAAFLSSIKKKRKKRNAICGILPQISQCGGNTVSPFGL